MKKTLSVILSLVLCALLTALPACAASTTTVPTKLSDPITGNTFTYSYSGKTLTIRSQYRDPDSYDNQDLSLLPFLTTSRKADQNVILASLYDTFCPFWSEIPFLFSPLVQSGKIDTVKLAWDNGTYTMKFRVDAKGNVTQVSYPGNKEQKALNLKYDSRNRLVSGTKQIYSEMVSQWIPQQLKITYGKNDSITSLYLDYDDTSLTSQCTSDSQGRLIRTHAWAQDSSENQFTYQNGTLNAISVLCQAPEAKTTITLSNGKFYRNGTELPVTYTE